MGIIQKQTITGSVYSYIGVLIGFLNMGILMPRIFSSGQIGLTQVMLSMATILGQIGNLGFIDLSNRIFPWFRNKDIHDKGFLGLGLLVTLAGTVFVSVLFFFNSDYIFHSNAGEGYQLNDYSGQMVLLIILTVWFTFFDNYVRILYNATLGTFLRDLLTRFLNSLLILIFYLRVIDFNGFLLLYILNQGLIQISVLIIWMIRNNEMRVGNFIRYIDRDMAKKLVSLAGYGLVAGLSGIAVSNIDKYMINYHLGLDQAGIYAISFYFATIIMIPGRALGRIAVPVIADAWKRDDIKVVSEIYSKSCINQIAIGMLLVTGIIANLHNIYRILPDTYSGGEWIIIMVSLSNFFNNATGASVYILSTSQYYRYQTWLMLFLIVLVLASNYFLIPVIGIEGAALASLVSVIISSAARIYIIWVKTGLWPYRMKNLLTIGAGVVAFLISLAIPHLPLIPDIIIRSSVITIVFLASVYYFRLSDEVNSIVVFVMTLIFRRG